MPQARRCSVLVSLAPLYFATPMTAQGATACLQGRVFVGPGVPVAGARVTVTFTAFTTTTDDSGRYVFLSIPADTVDLRVTYVGHTALRVDGLQLPAGRLDPPGLRPGAFGARTAPASRRRDEYRGERRPYSPRSAPGAGRALSALRVRRGEHRVAQPWGADRDDDHGEGQDHR